MSGGDRGTRIVTDPEGPFRSTLAPWYNRVERYRTVVDRDGVRDQVPVYVKALAMTGEIAQYKYGTTTPCVRPEHQVGVVCSPESHLVVIDLDDRERYEGTDLYRLLVDTYGRPTVQRSNDPTRQHWWLDYRAVPELYPRQGPIAGGDVKSNGFVPVPGSRHYSGGTYDRVGDLQVVTREVAEAVLAARDGHRSLGGGSGAHQVGTYSEPDSLSLVGRLVARGLDYEAAYDAWLDEVSSWPSRYPWTAEHRDVFERHWSYCIKRQGAERATAEGAPAQPPIWGRPAAKGLVDGFCSLEIVGIATPLAIPADLVTKASDQAFCLDQSPIAALTDSKKILAKLAAEEDKNPLSLDWATAPSGTLDERGQTALLGAREVYARVMHRRAAGSEVTPDYLAKLDPTGACRAWLTSRDHPLLLVTRDTVYVLPDPARERDDGPAAKYPGWYGHESRFWVDGNGDRQYRDPRSGSSWTQDYHERVEAAYQDFLATHAGEEAEHSDRLGAEWLNRPDVRKGHNMDDLRAATPGHVARIRKRLLKSGLIHVRRKAQPYRRRHTWRSVPAVYGLGPAPAKARLSTRRQTPNGRLQRDEFELTAMMRIWARDPGGSWAETDPAEAVAA